MNKSMINKLLASTIVTLISLPTFASNPEDEFIRKGNDKYEDRVVNVDPEVKDVRLAEIPIENTSK